MAVDHCNCLPNFCFIPQFDGTLNDASDLLAILVIHFEWLVAEGNLAARSTEPFPELQRSTTN